MTPEEAVDLYLAAWNADDDGERLALVRRAFAEDAVRVGHDVVRGPDAIAAAMSQLEARRTSPIEVRNGWLRFEWAATTRDGEHVEGVDVAEHDADGRLQRLIVFYSHRVSTE